MLAGMKQRDEEIDAEIFLATDIHPLQSTVVRRRIVTVSTGNFPPSKTRTNQQMRLMRQEESLKHAELTSEKTNQKRTKIHAKSPSRKPLRALYKLK